MYIHAQHQLTGSYRAKYVCGCWRNGIKIGNQLRRSMFSPGYIVVNIPSSYVATLKFLSLINVASTS